MKDRLKQLRRILNLKQREVAERLEINVGQVGAWECGKERIPPARVYQLCKEYNVRRAWLVDGTGEIFESESSKEKAQEEFITSVFNRLTPEQQKRILNALRAHLQQQTAENGKTQINNGTVNGPMTQN